MDPDPLSLLFSIRFLFLFNTFFIVLLIISLSSIFLLFVLSCLSLVLKTIGTDELKELEENETIAFDQLQSLFNKNVSMSSLFLLSKLFLILFFVSTTYLFLQEFNLGFVLANIIIFFALAMSIWVLPKIFAKDADWWVKVGLGMTSKILLLFTPLANHFAPDEAQLPLHDVSLEELKTALPESEDTKPTVANLALYKQVLRFDKLFISNVMRPKNEIVGIKAIYNFKEVLTKMQSSSFSRLPVYDGNWSNILGIIHCKDLLPYTHLDKLDWSKFIRPITFVSPDDYAQDVLRIFQQGKNHMAIVRNSENRIAGIVTLEDITEEIIGEIDDE